MEINKKELEEIISGLEGSLKHKKKIKDAVLIYNAEHFDFGTGFSTLERVEEHFMLVEEMTKRLQAII